MTFDELGLSAKVLKAISEAGYDTPTPIQEGAIPIAVTGRDVLGIAQTGTGKTAAFTLPMLTHLERGRARARMPRSLILAPTRELAAQVAEAFEQYGKDHKLNVALLIGGVSFAEQNKKLDRGADVLIATPGRLLDHFERGRILMTGVEILVIDEADRMLDMGFIPDIEKICKLLPPRRQTLFFSATMPDEITRLVKTFLRDPERVEVARQSLTAATITQRFMFVSSEAREKRAQLRKLIRSQDELNNGIIFCNRKRDVAILHKSLTTHGFNAGSLHGDMDQRARMETLDAFRNGDITLLAASDVAARGLDIPEVSHVFNFDVPVHAEDYVHRIGRTGRAGREGYAATLVTSDDGRMMTEIAKFIDGEQEWLGDAPGADDYDTRKRGGRGRGRSNGSSASEKRGGEKTGSGRTRRRRGGDKASSDTSTRDTAAAKTETEPNTSTKAARTEPAMSATVKADAGNPRPRAARSATPRDGDDETGASAAAGEPRRSRPRSRKVDDTASESGKRAPRRDNETKKGGGDRSRGGNSDGNKIVGLGDHVPAFLTRPVKG
ncbi:MAG: DEAD/DEAH box helicase [Pseudomonadota bacterium]